MKTNKMKDKYFELFSAQLYNCYEPTENCPKKAIKAHSIQNSKTLSQLSQDGHVIVPKLKIGKIKALPTIYFEKEGINKASTFTGLCSYHDNLIFEPIDKFDFETKNLEQLFLISYRSVLKELYACTLGAYKMQSMYTERVKKGLSPPNQPDEHGLRATAHLQNAYEMYLYKKEFDEVYLSQNYKRLIHHIINFEHNFPTIAVSATISLDEIEVPHDVARVSINVFPNNKKTYIIFSFLPKDAPYVNRFLREVFSCSGDKQLEVISKIILESCENLALSPRYFDSLSSQEKEKIIKFFVDTTFINHPHDNLQNFSLFNLNKG